MYSHSVAKVQYSVLTELILTARVLIYIISTWYQAIQSDCIEVQLANALRCNTAIVLRYKIANALRCNTANASRCNRANCTNVQYSVCTEVQHSECTMVQPSECIHVTNGIYPFQSASERYTHVTYHICLKFIFIHISF
jgi:hypothetical protein